MREELIPILRQYYYGMITVELAMEMAKKFNLTDDEIKELENYFGVEQ